MAQQQIPRSPRTSDDVAAIIVVDVIIPVHNAASTICSTVESAMKQVIPPHLQSFFVCDNHNQRYLWDVAVCCFDDGSSDESWEILSELNSEHERSTSSCVKESSAAVDSCSENKTIQQQQPPVPQPLISITCKLLIARGSEGLSRGAGYARNQAAAMRSSLHSEYMDFDNAKCHSFLCFLDSDDIMHKTRIAEQVHCMLRLPGVERERTLLGSTFDRDPPDSTWHYSKWANELTDERLYLERFREVTLIQPTWMISRTRWQDLGGYLEAPNPGLFDKAQSTGVAGNELVTNFLSSSEPAQNQTRRLRLIHPIHDTPHTLRLAEDLRFFHAHLYDSGLLKLLRTDFPLVTYRHRAGISQSSTTSRKLLLQLRVLAFETCILRQDTRWNGSFVVWGAGRDGKDFIKHLAEDTRKRVTCLVDIDTKKIDAGYYINGDIKIPIVHFSWLARDAGACRLLYDETFQYGAINKSKPNEDGPSKEDGTLGCHSTRPPKKARTEHSSSIKTPPGLELSQLPYLPVVVCVAMYRTNGALERNVRSIGRTEGKDLWHFN